MKLISPDTVEVTLRGKFPAIYDSRGRVVEPEKRRLFAKFERRRAPDRARELGLARFSNEKALPEFQDDGFAPGDWLAYLDTEDEAYVRGWTEEEKEAAERRMREIAEENGYLVVERPKAPAPWPAYDRLVPQGQRTVEKIAAKIAETVGDLGLEPSVVAAYERENLNRPQVLEALERLVAPAPVAEPEEELVDA